MKKKNYFWDSFPRQIHFPVLDSRIGIFTIIVMIVLAVVVVGIVLWLKS